MIEDQQKHRSEAKVEQDAENRTAPSGLVVHKAIAKEGREELARSSSALFWSGLAAGMSMGASLIAEGLLRTYLPEAPWQALVSKFGYCVGFLIVVLGRQQLFTENTITPVLPILMEFRMRTVLNMLRLWAIVLLANMVGGLAVSWAVAGTVAFEPEVKYQFAMIGRDALEHGFLSITIRAVFAGWLIALMVWVLPFAEAARVWMIIIITYLIGLGHLSHVVAGTINTMAAAWMGAATWGQVALDYFLPALVGNVIGGVLLVAIVNHAQVVAGSKPRAAWPSR